MYWGTHARFQNTKPHHTAPQNELVEGLSIRQLAHFCRVLALLVFVSRHWVDRWTHPPNHP